MSKPADRPYPAKPDTVTTPRVISIIDDDKSFREAMARLMRSHGYSVAAFGSAEDFLRSDRVDETACVICDVRMPGMSGTDLQNALNASHPGIPIIFATAHPTVGAREAALAAGAIGFLRKPCSEDTLVHLLQKALRGGGAIN